MGRQNYPATAKGQLDKHCDILFVVNSKCVCSPTVRITAFEALLVYWETGIMMKKINNSETDWLRNAFDV